MVLELLGPDGLCDHFAALVQRKKKMKNLGSNPPSLWASAGLHRKCTRFALSQVSLVGRDGGAWQKNPRVHHQEPTSSLMFKC